jgi:hypothetical protein
MIRALFDRLAKRGFQGPFYSGVAGKARFVFESVVGRTDLVFAASPKTVTGTVANARRLRLDTVSSFRELEKFRATLDTNYHPGYVDRWRAPFTWGEHAAIGTIDGQLVSFAWIQYGSPNGFPTYYGRLLQNEARILRLGVLPSNRRLGLSGITLSLLLQSLFGSGIERAYIECHKNNLPSVRSFLSAGFRPIGAITVIELPAIRGFVRWKPLQPIVDEFRSLGIALDVSAESR